MAFVAELRSLRPERTPGAVIHAAHYAMFHAARAVLVLHDGVKTAKSHQGMITRYSLVAGTDDAGRHEARALNPASDMRHASDYATDGPPTADLAQAMVARADAFLAYNAERFGFRLS